MNVLWEMGGAEEILIGVLERAKGMLHGVTCGAGMPYKLSEIAEKYQVHYHPIVSSMRAFRALWKRAYSKQKQWLGSVVYEDPWLAGGHNGLSNSEDPTKPQDPYPRVVELRKFMNEVGLSDTPIIMAGGAWHLSDWEDWLDNPDIGPIAFQFGTRPLLTQESPIPERWKKELMKLSEPYGFGPRKRPHYVTPEDMARIEQWVADGYDEALKTPDETLIFVSKEKADEIVKDQIDCMGCLSHCRFSNWKDHDDYTTGKKADPRSFCIQKTLQDIIHGSDVNNELMFSGHNAYKFGQDPFYEGGNIPTVGQLVDRIMTGQ